ncbi:MAG: hypothetical protein AVDCRST_MAG05-44, partial [uncultured Rubrobacteraceae bacterium]
VRHEQRQVLRAFRGNRGLRAAGVPLPGQGAPGNSRLLRLYVRERGDAGRQARRRRHPRAVRLRLHHHRTRQPRPPDRGRHREGSPLPRGTHGVGHQPLRQDPRVPLPPLPHRRHLRGLHKGHEPRHKGPRKDDHGLRPRRVRRGREREL